MNYRPPSDQKHVKFCQKPFLGMLENLGFQTKVCTENINFISVLRVLVTHMRDRKICAVHDRNSDKS